MTEIAMSKHVYRQTVGHDPNQTVYYPTCASGSAWSRCDFDGRSGTMEMLILPEFDLRMVCADCECHRPNVVHIEDDDAGLVC